MRLVSIQSGSDWTDASYEFMEIPDDMDLNELQKEHYGWLNDEYWPEKTGDKIRCKFKSFVEFLKDRGAKEFEHETFTE